jgi:hypothetical protein
MADWFSTLMGVGSGDPNNPYRNALSNNAQQLSGMGQGWGNAYNANQAGINGTAAGMQNTIGGLQAIANGQNSVSAMQLQQGLQQNQAQQMSMAASATPQNQAMAARNAMLNAGNAASGMMGQQAVAGLQERNQAYGQLANAQQNLGQLQTTQSGQNMQGALGAYGASNGAYGNIMGNPQKTWGSLALGALGGAAAAGAKFA